MALIPIDEDGTYPAECPLCGQPLIDPVFATTQFIEDPSHPLFPYSDAAMDWECYADWEHRKAFAKLWFDSNARVLAENPYWRILYRDDDVIAALGTEAGEVSICLAETASDIRVPRSEWAQWLREEWEDSASHPVEKAAIEQALARLKEIKVP